MDKDFLKGKRIAITALELENKEHRGIASFIKSLIHILNKYGAEIYLITGFDCHQNFQTNFTLFAFHFQKKIFFICGYIEAVCIWS